MRNLVFCCLMIGCRTQPENSSSDLGGADLAVRDLAVGGQATVVTCCGGPAPQCTAAPDGGCAQPMEPCSFGGGCYLPCTPPPNYPVELPSTCLTHPGDNLCKCIMENGGQDPCYPNGGSSCDVNTINLPAAQIVCQCY